MKKLLIIISIFCLSDLSFAQKNKSKVPPPPPAPNFSIPLNTESWEAKEGKLEFFEKNGIKFMRVKSGNQGAVSPKNVSFNNGIIEFDFEPAAPMTLGSSPTVYFRVNTGNNDAEIFYIRARPDNPRANDAIQYCPILVV